MKFEGSGGTYDTATSDAIAFSHGTMSMRRKLPLIGAWGRKDEVPCDGWLYKTRDGEFWLHERRAEWAGEGEPRVVTHRVIPLTPKQARKWIVRNDALVLDWWEL